jgi:predicted nucleic acid-binding protein
LRADSFARKPKPRIYVDTTIPSAYHTVRTDPDSVERRITTRLWWDIARYSCELLVSPEVLREAARGSSEMVPRRLEMLKDLGRLYSSEEIDRTAALYVQHKLMPRDVQGDALHVALASHHHCDALVTWNYRHLANPNKLDRLRKLNTELGLPVPRMRTPRQLLEEDS